MAASTDDDAQDGISLISDFVQWQKAASPPAYTFRLMTVAPADPQVLYVTSKSANLWKSSDGGASWQQMGERKLGAHIFSNVAVHPDDPDRLFASNGILHRSLDGGQSWQALFGSEDSLGVVAVAFAPGDPQILYAGDDQGRLHRSGDGGATWAQVGQLPVAGQVTELWIDPSDPEVLLAGGVFGLYRSGDGGQRFTAVLSGDIAARSLTPGGGARAWVIQQNRLLRSDDGGQNWQAVAPGPFRALAVAGEALYAIDTQEQVLASIDGGQNWTTTGYDAAALGAPLSLALDPADPRRLFAVSDSAIARSTDGGATWTRDAEGLVVDDFFTLAVDPNDPGRLYAGLFWTLGLYRSDDGADSWQPLPEYMHTPPGGEHYPMSIAIDPRDGDTLFVTGTTGLRVSRDGGQSWDTLSGALGNFHMHGLALAPSDPDVLYVGAGLGDMDQTVAGTSVHKSNDNGLSWQALSGGLPSDEEFNVYVIAVAPSDSQRVYLGTNLHDWANPHPDAHGTAKGVFRSTDGGARFEAVNTGLSELNVLSLAVHPSDPDTVYAGTVAEGRGRLFKTTDGGATWTRIDQGLPAMDVHAIALWPQDPEVIVVGLGQNVQAGTGLPVAGAGIYVSEDGGRSWRDATGPLQGRERVVMTLAFSADGNVLYAGTDDGIFRGQVRGQ